MTRNLFWGQGPTTHRLDVVDGTWPTDVHGAVFVVGPDKRRPGGHWFSEHGLLQKIHLTPGADGRITVEHRRVETRVERIRRRVPWLFKTVEFMELSPFGVTNMANTNVEPVDGRLFLGYDAGRPVEVDPETLEHLTPVGANGEWFQALPGLLEPLVAVAAHPAADHAERRLWFVNYTQVSPPGEAAETYLARWDLDGPVRRWRLRGMLPFDSIHDVKVSEHHLVVSDLPFVFEPASFAGKPRTQRNQTHGTLWIVAKADLDATPEGGDVHVTEVRVPMPTGHLTVDHEEVDGLLRVVLQHIPLGDLMITMKPDTAVHPDHEGLVALGVQPSIVGRYLIEAATGRIVESDTAMDAERAWGGILATADVHSPEARRRQRQLWYAGVGYDPELIPPDWWALYGDATDGVVAPGDLPAEPIPGSLARIDLEAMKVAEVFTFDGGAFPSPPTFVPRREQRGPDDGYVVVTVHQDGPKEVQVFDAADIEAGPIARATSPTFHPSLLLHSCWMPARTGPRRSRYRIGFWRDLAGALGGIPGALWGMLRQGPALARAARRSAR